MPALSNEGGISLSHKPKSLMFMAVSNGVKRKDRFFFGYSSFFKQGQRVNLDDKKLSHSDI